MSPLTTTDTGDAPDLTNAFQALVDQFRALAARMATVEATVAGTTGVSAGIQGPKGDPGTPGRDGTSGGGTDDDSGIEAELAALRARVAAVETGHTGGGGGGGSLGPYYDAVLADGPVGFWPLTETDTTSHIFYDHSGNSLTGTVDMVITTGTPQPVFGGTPLVNSQPADHSLHFPGLTRGDQIPTYARVTGVAGHLDDSAGQSFECFVQIDGINDITVIAHWESISYAHLSGQQYENDINTPEHYGGDGKNYSAFCENELSPGLSGEPTRHVPHHVVYTRKRGGQYKIYLDGALVGDGVRPAGSFGLGRGILILGGNDESGNKMVGSIGYVAIYNKELTADRIAAHYTASL